MIYAIPVTMTTIASLLSLEIANLSQGGAKGKAAIKCDKLTVRKVSH